MAKHYIEYLFMGFEEPVVRKVYEVDKRVLDKREIPDSAYGYRFFDSTCEDGLRKNITPYTYFGTEYSLEDILMNFPGEMTLISNMRQSNSTRAVHTSVGKWIILEPDEEVIYF